MTDSGNQVMLSLDYELFFGRSTGSVQRCLIDPVTALVASMPKAVKLSLFVDAGYLCRLAAQSEKYAVLAREYDSVRTHLDALSNEGHDIQLHIHSHWEDTFYDGEGWQTNTSRYRLHQFSKEERSEIVGRYKAELEAVSNQPVFAYRAGGWCLQPFADIAEALRDNGIWLDSTVYDQGYSSEPARHYDYRDYPEKPSWRFESDPLQPLEEGFFLEIPISAQYLSPMFFWRMALHRFIRTELDSAYGDGQSMSADSTYYRERLMRGANSPVAIDGLKARALTDGYREHQRKSRAGVFNVMGHPKSLTPNSVATWAEFCQQVESNSTFVTFQAFTAQQPTYLMS